MDDFLVLSVSDLQLGPGQRINKKDVMAYIMVGGKCIDCLVLGMNSATMQKQEANSGGQSKAAAAESGGQDIATGPNTHHQRKTKIPLFERSKNLQIVLKKIGAEKDRFGSVSIPIKKFANYSGKSDMQWMTLYDSLDDDMFEGQIGQDDEHETPKILVEFTVVGAKYTSVMNNLDHLKTSASKNQSKLDDITAKRKEWVKSEISNHKRIAQRKKQGLGNFNNGTLSVTVEYIESRSDNRKLNRVPFAGRVIDSNDKDESEHAERVRKNRKQLEIERQLQQQYDELNEICKKFDIQLIKSDIVKNMKETCDQVDIDSNTNRMKTDEVISFIDKMIDGHHTSVKAQTQDVLEFGMESYKVYLEEIESQDLKALKLKLNELRLMERHLERDIGQCNVRERNLLQQREQDQLDASDSMTRLRMEVEGRKQELEQFKQLLKDQPEEPEQEGSEYGEEDREAQDNYHLNVMTQKEKQQNARDCQKGRDELYTKFYNENEEQYTKLRDEQDKLFNLQSELSETQQKFRDSQMTNILLNQQRDEQIDMDIDLRVGIQKMSKEIITTSQKKNKYILELEKLMNDRYKAVEERRYMLATVVGQKDEIQQRRDELFKAVIELERIRQQVMVQVNRDTQGQVAVETQVLNQYNEIRRQPVFDMSKKVKKQVESAKIQTKTNGKGSLAFSDPHSRKEAEFRLSKLLKELELKQRQMVKLYQIKETTTSHKSIQKVRVDVGGRVNDAIENLTTFTKECKDDEKELKWREDQTKKDLVKVTNEIQHQDQDIHQLQKEATGLSVRLDQARKQYDKMHPKAAIEKERSINEKTQLAQGEMRVRDDRIDLLLQRLQDFDSDETIHTNIDEIIHDLLQKNKIDHTQMQHVKGTTYLARQQFPVQVLFKADKFGGKKLFVEYMDAQGYLAEQLFEEFISYL